MDASLKQNHVRALELGKDVYMLRICTRWYGCSNWRSDWLQDNRPIVMAQEQA